MRMIRTWLMSLQLRNPIIETNTDDINKRVQMQDIWVFYNSEMMYKEHIFVNKYLSYINELNSNLC